MDNVGHHALYKADFCLMYMGTYIRVHSFKATRRTSMYLAQLIGALGWVWQEAWLLHDDVTIYHNSLKFASHDKDKRLLAQKNIGN